MSKLGPVYLGPQVEETEYGRSWWQPSDISQSMQSKVDEEINRIVEQAYKKSLEILGRNRKKLDVIAKRLVEHETIESDEFEKLMK